MVQCYDAVLPVERVWVQSLARKLDPTGHT